MARSSSSTPIPTGWTSTGPIAAGRRRRASCSPSIPTPTRPRISRTSSTASRRRDADGSRKRMSSTRATSMKSVKSSTSDRAKKIVAALARTHPDAKCALVHSNALELLVATILSAQCTDVRVNLVTRDLFKKYKTAADYANADPKTLEQEIRSTGFFRNKAKSLIGMGKMLVEKFGGEVPSTMEELLE